MSQDEEIQPTDLITPRAAAARLGLSRQSIYHAIEYGELPASRLAHRWVLRVADVDAFEPRRFPGRPKGETGKMEESR